MKRKVLLLLAIMAAVSLSACTDNPISTGDKPGMEAAASTASTEESRNADEALICTELQLSSSEQVAELPEAESVVSKPTEPSETEARSEQTAVVSQPSVPESSETPRPSAQETKPDTTTTPPVSTEPEPTPSVPPVTPSPEPTTEPQPTEPACDVSRYVSYAKSYGSGIGLTLDSSATGCWDTPIEAHAGCIYLERDIRDCLDWYKASGYTAFWVWSVDAGGGNYEIYIGYA
jgi:hypothetical protein